MFTHMNIASMLDTTLLSRTLEVIRLAHCVVVGPSYDSLSSSMVMQTRWFLALLGLMYTKIRPYATMFSAGTADR